MKKKIIITIVILSTIIVILLNHITISTISKTSVIEFFKLPILGSVLVALVSIVTVIVTNYFNLKRVKLETKEKIILENFSIRRKANSKLFSSLLEYKKYFELFIHPGYEFKESSNYTEFAPLTVHTKLSDDYSNLIINLHPSTIKLVDNLFHRSSLLLNMAIMIFNDQNSEYEPLITESGVESSCLYEIEEIEKIMENLKEVNGMNELNKL